MQKKIVNIIGKVLMVLAFAFIVYMLWQYWDQIDFTMLANGLVVAGLCVMFLLHGLNIFIASQFFSRLLNVMSGKKVNRVTVVKIYCTSNVYRYIPGNVMHYVGRNQIATIEGIPHSEVAFSTIVEAIFLILSALVVSLICVADYLVSFVGQLTISNTVWLILAAVVVVAIVVLVILRKKIRRLAAKYWGIIRRLKLRTCLEVLGMMAFRLLFNAFIYLGTIVLMGQPITLELLPQILGLFVMSWVIGYLTPGVPAGLGVREFIMIMFLGDVLNQDILMSSTIIYRVICIFGDVMAMVYARIYVAVKTRGQKPPEQTPTKENP